MNPTPHKMVPHPREDVWRLYLGLPQQFGFVDVAEYTPHDISDPRTAVFRLTNINGVEERLVEMAREFERIHGDAAFNRAFFEEDVHGFFTPNAHEVGVENHQGNQHWTGFLGVLGNFEIHLGEDENGKYVSYRDHWDLDPSFWGKKVEMERVPVVPGWPVEIYHRIYYE